MTSDRRTALVVGVLFILTFVTSIAAVFAYGTVLTDPNYVTGPGADTGVFLGAFLELFLIITNIGCAVVLFPILKWQNEAISLGYVAARIMECTFILVGIIAVLAVVSLRQDAASANAGSPAMLGTSLVAIKNWTFLLGPGFADGIGTGLLLGWLMYRSGLVHRRMALFGVIGGPLLAASGAAVLMGVIPQGSSVQGLMTVPEIIWEAYLGLWLTFKGFNAAAPVLALARREHGIRDQAVPELTSRAAPRCGLSDTPRRDRPGADLRGGPVEPPDARATDLVPPRGTSRPARPTGLPLTFRDDPRAE